MSREVPGALDPTWSSAPLTARRTHHPLKMHLRTGEGPLAGPACGNDLRVAKRGQGGGALPLTDDLDAVTCAMCRRSYAFQLLADAEPEGES